MSVHPAPYPAALSIDPASRSRIPGDDKAPFDDLIDQYAVSYKAHATDSAVLAGGHGDREPPLYDLTHQVTNFSDDSLKDIKSLEGHRTERLDWEYPPPAAKTEAVKMEKEASASWWEVMRATVRGADSYFWTAPNAAACIAYSRLYCVPPLYAHCSGGDNDRSLSGSRALPPLERLHGYRQR